jgi:hypothetical protein
MPDPRMYRLMDLKPNEAVEVTCRCGRSVVYLPGTMQRWHRVPSDTLIFDLQFRLRCKHCNRRDGFRIAVLDHDKLSRSAPDCRTVVVDGRNA